MNLSERWLRTWINPTLDTATWAHRLNMAGNECGLQALPALPETLVVAEIIAAEKHPQADRLQVCQVQVADNVVAQIVCGAANARVGIKVPCALPGTVMPNGLLIKAAQLRGVGSNGMLCSASELAFAEKSEGLLELAPDAPVGVSINAYLGLPDQQLQLDLTPNRGDCLSVRGLARESAAVLGLVYQERTVAVPPAQHDHARVVHIENPQDCIVYSGCVVTGINPQATSPDWLKESLRRSGIRSIHPIVDITNYVLLEWGQPLHAFDLYKLSGDISVRRAHAGEMITLLNEQTVQLAQELLICDASGPIALAGAMGGQSTAVGSDTTAIFFESACFSPQALAGVGRKHKFSSDALYRYERGVDPALSPVALARALELTVQICGGQVGGIHTVGSLPPAKTCLLRRARLQRLLGYTVADSQVEGFITALGGQWQADTQGWQVSAPSWRYDLAIEEDWIEEVARLHGYDNIPLKAYAAELSPTQHVEALLSPDQLKQALIAKGYQEVVSYSFVDAGVQAKLSTTPALALDNPLAETLGVMRTTLWASLLPILQYNQNRQQSRIRLFELGRRYQAGAGGTVAGILETPTLAGLISGESLPEQWGSAKRMVDFFDLKGDLAPLLVACEYRADSHVALQPGQSASVWKAGVCLGWVGRLHPDLVEHFGLNSAPCLFELAADALRERGLPRLEALSEHPHSRRDLALLVPQALAAGAIVSFIQALALPLLKEVFIFDQFLSESLGIGVKSVAMGLIFQAHSRNLSLAEVDEMVQTIQQKLQQEWGITLR
jgi:phenylalanyl-tRNA synthetase beta chain